MMDAASSSSQPNGGKPVGASGNRVAGMLGKVSMGEDQAQFLALGRQSPARLADEQTACGENASSLARDRQLPGGAKDGTATIPGQVGFNGVMDGLREKGGGEPAFMDEKQLLAKLPISRRTLGNWKATGVLPYIKIGRRCLYDWASVHGALLRRQRGGQ